MPPLSLIAQPLPRRAEQYRSHRLRNLLIVVGLASAGVMPATLGASSASPAAPATVGSRSPERHVVTLVTGDRVTVTGSGEQQHVGIDPAPGRERTSLSITRVDGHIHVVPVDAFAMLGKHTIDARLFDVTLLIELGYDDAHRSSVPVLLGYKPSAAASMSTRLSTPLVASGSRITHDLPAIRGAAARVSREHGDRPWKALVAASGSPAATPTAGIDHIWLDGVRQPALDVSTGQIGAPVAWAAGFDGTGVTVAVLDTGIDATHPDLVGKVAVEKNFTADADPRDLVGHGTHVASIIAGSGAASGGKYRGVAPGATLLDGKVCADQGCSESSILAGMQWASADQHARVVNLSLGGPDVEGIDPLEEAVNTLSAANGTLFVIAAGNDGPGDGTLNSPGTADAALTVGAVDSADELAFFSSRGPRAGDSGLKPDITAPGFDIVAARSSTGVIGEPIDANYVRMSGTSMATPHVAGAAAIVAQAHPTWIATELKADLMASAKPNPSGGVYQQGAGRVDVARAITQSVTASPASLSLGVAAWPHADDLPTVRTLTYVNNGAADRTLDLSLVVSGPGAANPPAGMFSLDRAAVVVPAGGTASVTITVDTTLGAVDGLWSGELIAGDGTEQVSTPVAIDQEFENYRLTISHLDGAGAPTEFYGTLVHDLDTGATYSMWNPSGTVERRVPPGRYELVSTIDTSQPVGIALLSYPEFTVSGDTAITLDARTARAVELNAPGAQGELKTLEVGFTHSGGFSASMFTTSPGSVFSAAVGPPVAADEYTSHVHAEWLVPSRTGSVAQGTTYFGLAAQQQGSLFTGYQRTWRASELARVTEQYDPLMSGSVGLAYVWPFFPNDSFIVAEEFPVDTPSSRTLYLSTDAGTAWTRRFDAGLPGPDGELQLVYSQLQAAPITLRARERSADRWNAGPFTIAVPPLGTEASPSIGRIGDDIAVGLFLFGDAAGHAGFSPTGGGSTTLYAADGSVVGTSDGAGFGGFTVPAGAGRYRLVVEGDRSGYTDLSTHFRYEWGFRSSTTPADQFLAVPLFVVRPTPTLAQNSVRAGERVRIPLTVQYQPGSTVQRLRSVRVAVSYDDGATWRRADVRCGGRGCSADLGPSPRTAAYASLRITAVDAAGSSVDETVVHAYRVRSRCSGAASRCNGAR